MNLPPPANARRLAHTDLTVSSVAYGCMHIGGDWTTDPPSPGVIENALACVRTALENGITVFDHADIYSRTKSEEVFGHVWSELGLRREDVVLQSKCGIRRAAEPNAASPHRFDQSFDHIVSSVDGILKRLRTDHLDILLLHRPDPLVDPEEVARAFQHLRTNGMVRWFGVSNHNSAQIQLLQRSLDRPLVANQLEFNLLQSDLIDEGVTVNDSRQRQSYRGDGTIEYCRLQNILVQAWSPLARGRFTPAAADADAATRAAAAAVAHEAERHGVSGEAVLIAWILRHPARIMPIIGSTKPERIRSAARGMEVELTREEWYRLYLAGRGRDIP